MRYLYDEVNKKYQAIDSSQEPKVQSMRHEGMNITFSVTFRQGYDFDNTLLDGLYAEYLDKLKKKREGENHY